MPNFIRTKQIDQADLSGFFIDTIGSQSGLLLEYISGVTLNETVLLTGNQRISGVKTFANNLNVSGDLTVAGTLRYNEIIDTTVTGNLSGYTGVFQQVYADNLVYNTGNQTISGDKIFKNKIRIGDSQNAIYSDDDSNLIISGLDDTPRGMKFILANNEKQTSITFDPDYHGLVFNGDSYDFINQRPVVEISSPFSRRPVALLDEVVLNTGNQTISGVKTFTTGIVAPNIVYNTGNQNISGQKRFVDQDIVMYPGYNPGSNPSIFIASHPANTTRFKSVSEYRTNVYPNPNFYYSGIGAASGTEIYYNTGTSRWWYILNNGLLDASPIVTANWDATLLPLTNWSGGNVKIYPTYSHNTSHHANGNDAINPILIDAIATTGGNQTISGVKTFATGVIISGDLQVSGTGIFNAIDLNSVDIISLSGVDVTITSGLVVLTNPVSAPNLVYNTGNQNISGVKTFNNSGIFTSGLDLNNSNLINATPQLVNETTNFIISGNDNGRVILANHSTNEITGTIVSGNPIGFNTSIIQINSGIFITGSGNGITINSFGGYYRTAGKFATVSLLHTGNNGYIMYGNTI